MYTWFKDYLICYKSILFYILRPLTHHSPIESLEAGLELCEVGVYTVL